MEKILKSLKSGESRSKNHLYRGLPITGMSKDPFLHIIGLLETFEIIKVERSRKEHKVSLADRWEEKFKELKSNPQRLNSLPKLRGGQRKGSYQKLPDDQEIIHCNHLIDVYQKWLSSGVSNVSRYSYGSFDFGIRIVERPDHENYYLEARDDLQCYPRVYQRLVRAEHLIDVASHKADAIVNDMEDSVKKLMNSYNIVEHYLAGKLAVHRCYFQKTLIVHLTVKRIAEGNKYRQPIFEFKDGSIRAPDEGVTLAEGIKSKEVRNLSKVFHHFPSELTTSQGDDFFQNLSDRVKALQDDFQKARARYLDFKDKLMADVIKPLETTHRITNGGKCHICRLLQR